MHYLKIGKNCKVHISQRLEQQTACLLTINDWRQNKFSDIADPDPQENNLIPWKDIYSGS